MLHTGLVEKIFVVFKKEYSGITLISLHTSRYFCWNGPHFCLRQYVGMQRLPLTCQLFCRASGACLWLWIYSCIITSYVNIMYYYLFEYNAVYHRYKASENRWGPPYLTGVIICLYQTLPSVDAIISLWLKKNENSHIWKRFT